MEGLSILKSGKIIKRDKASISLKAETKKETQTWKCSSSRKVGCLFSCLHPRPTFLYCGGPKVPQGL